MFMCCCFLLVNVPVYFVVVWYECMQTVELYGRYHFLAIPIRICCNFSEKIQIKLIFQWTVAKNNIPIPWIDLSNGKICMNCANKHQLTFPLPQPLKYSYVVCAVIYINAPIQFIFISLAHAVILFDIPINNNENFTNYITNRVVYRSTVWLKRFDSLLSFIEQWFLFALFMSYVRYPHNISLSTQTNRRKEVFEYIAENLFRQIAIFPESHWVRMNKKNLRKMHQTLNTK